LRGIGSLGCAQLALAGSRRRDESSMTFEEYQREARSTDTTADHVKKRIIVPLLGLAGEAATLLSAYKKYLRDGTAYTLYKEEVAEELGDVLWYLSTVASHYGLSLVEIAANNLIKTKDRFHRQVSLFRLDGGFPAGEQFPRKIEFMFLQDGEGRVQLFRSDSGKRVGDALRDNAYDDDGYRYHDAFHLSYVAVLGWSPVIRALLHLKRKSAPRVDEVEDGGRAIVIDEGISAFVFGYALQHNYFDGVDTIDYSILRTVRVMTAGLEVAIRTPKDWEDAILKGYDVFRQLRRQNGGRVSLDLDAHSIEYVGS
jgi:NTP pyrophosphatase (non-canonical NTP hydrolase)